MTLSRACLFSLKKLSGTRFKIPLLFITSSFIYLISHLLRIKMVTNWKARKVKKTIYAVETYDWRKFVNVCV